MRKTFEVLLGIAIIFYSSAAISGPSEAKGKFPSARYEKRWAGNMQKMPKTPTKKLEAQFYNPPCTEPDAPCNGDPTQNWPGDPRDVMEAQGYEVVGDGFTSELERVTVYVKRNFDFSWEIGNTGLCVTEECRTYALPLPILADTASPAVAGEVLKAVKDNIKIISPLLDKCVKTPFVNERIRTPDQDMGVDYWVARSSIESTYAGNTSMIRFGMRVDVEYPSGQKVQFLIMGTDHSQSPVVTSLRRAFDGIPNPTTTPCK